MTKDRLAELHKKLQTSSNDSSHVVIEMSTKTGEKSSLLDPFFQDVESIKEQLDDLKSDVERIAKLHSFMLKGTQADGQTTEERRKDVEDISTRIRKKSVSIKNQIKQVGLKLWPLIV